MNNHEWEIKEVTREEIKRIYERETGEETMCNISANSHDIIHEIVKEYFNCKKEKNVI